MALLHPWICVLVGCFSASLAGTSSLSDLYPPLWKESPGQFSDYKVENGTYIIDPWTYFDRIGAYKILINNTAKFFERFAAGGEQNILWGLALQHGWQYSSGRLADPKQMTHCGYESNRLCISVDSWWADINYFLCVLPFLAAVDSGIMGISSDQVLFLPPLVEQTKFCFNLSSCQSSHPELMRKWNVFYQHLQSPFRSFDDLLKYYWDAHTSTLQDTYRTFDDRIQCYSKPERYFERNWLLLLQYLNEMRFPTTLTRTHEFQQGLPDRMLASGDQAPFISDFTNLQNTVLFALNLLCKVDSATVSWLPACSLAATYPRPSVVRRHRLESVCVKDLKTLDTGADEWKMELKGEKKMHSLPVNDLCKSVVIRFALNLSRQHKNPLSVGR
ncbi:PREDICTED: protein LEG1 homolog [Condylura cristata]|uniref:protein LEG1 homolog n=1 Tax=Condylura cristata TaxID=143302 RepID=UPI0003346D98|nr:PREDICTED: protein LEG1 homolog [Condylura cristata]